MATLAAAAATTKAKAGFLDCHLCHIGLGRVPIHIAQSFSRLVDAVDYLLSPRL